jgi:type IV pilus assembly protein PilA
MYAWSLLNLIAPVLLLLLLVAVLQRYVPDSDHQLSLAAAGIGYLLLVYLLLPLYADSLYLYGLKRRGVAPKPPSAFTATGALLIIVIPGLMAYAVVSAQRDYGQRARIAEGLSIASSLKAPVAEFYQEQKKLPGMQEAARFRHAEAMKHTASVGWDPARGAIVVTMGEPLDGKRFEFAAVTKEGGIEWTCRSIDLEPKLLPMSCR